VKPLLYCSSLAFFLALSADLVHPIGASIKPMKVYVDVKNPITRSAIVGGLMKWQTELEDFTWEFSNDREDAVVFRDWRPEDILRIEQINGANSHWLATTFPSEKLVVFNRWPNREIYNTATHEIGHILINRLEHNDDKRSVMYPTQLETPQDILPSDLKWLTRYHLHHRDVVAFDRYKGRSFSIFTEVRPKYPKTIRFGNFFYTEVDEPNAHDIMFMRCHDCWGKR
jgi:hypothetical protein